MRKRLELFLVKELVRVFFILTRHHWEEAVLRQVFAHWLFLCAHCSGSRAARMRWSRRAGGADGNCAFAVFWYN